MVETAPFYNVEDRPERYGRVSRLITARLNRVTIASNESAWASQHRQKDSVDYCHVPGEKYPFPYACILESLDEH